MRDGTHAWYGTVREGVPRVASEGPIQRYTQDPVYEVQGQLLGGHGQYNGARISISYETTRLEPFRQIRAISRKTAENGNLVVLVAFSHILARSCPKAPIYQG